VNAKEQLLESTVFVNVSNNHVNFRISCGESSFVSIRHFLGVNGGNVR